MIKANTDVKYALNQDTSALKIKMLSKNYPRDVTTVITKPIVMYVLSNPYPYRLQ
jgi:hypothetical protein